MGLRQTAPWPIPIEAQASSQVKVGYHQVKYDWQTENWHYEARWHEQVPGAKLITRPSWHLERVRPGKGYGSTAAPRITQTLVGKSWLPTRQVRYWARRYNDGVATEREIYLLRLAHPAPIKHSGTSKFPRK
ncbi:hypothetical protein [Limosilactobacillus kribbianus]|uniref:hypothetical protein n=1 Tax=Limosilactobacillus kribbianus TaxID=2982695 RepID=UPI0022640157|nr:hypothetical protein [Limosilactobacillus kribbianus]